MNVNRGRYSLKLLASTKDTQKIEVEVYDNLEHRFKEYLRDILCNIG